MIHSKLIKALSLGAVLITSSLVKAEPLALNQVIDYALTHEPWLQANKYQQQAIEAQSIAAGTLPDPVLTVGLMNLPTDGFAFDQEGMTQFKVGLSQQFSRGDSLNACQLRADRHFLGLSFRVPTGSLFHTSWIMSFSSLWQHKGFSHCNKFIYYARYFSC